MESSLGADGVYSAKVPGPIGTSVAKIPPTTMHRLPGPGPTVASSTVNKPGILSRIAGRIGKMGTLGKIGLGVAAGVAGTKMLSNNNQNGQT